VLRHDQALLLGFVDFLGENFPVDPRAPHDFNVVETRVLNFLNNVGLVPIGIRRLPARRMIVLVVDSFHFILFVHPARLIYTTGAFGHYRVLLSHLEFS
jgi:hypothetical protein